MPLLYLYVCVCVHARVRLCGCVWVCVRAQNMYVRLGKCASGEHTPLLSAD